MLNKNTTKPLLSLFIISLILTASLADFRSVPFFQNTRIARAQSLDEIATDDYDYYQKYSLYLKYQKKQKYKKYRKYAKNKEKYGFANPKEKTSAKDAYLKYKLYKKDPVRYRAFAIYELPAKKYSKYKKYVTPYQKYSKYKKYKNYNKSSYDAGKNYSGLIYLGGYNRYIAAQAVAQSTIGEADLGAGILGLDGYALGSEISIGLVNYSRSNLQDSSFNISALNGETGNPIDYIIKDTAGTVLATIAAGATTKVKYSSDQTFRIYNSVPADIMIANDILFEPADPNLANTAVFDFNRPSSDYDQYRGKIKLHYYTGDNSIWAINYLPLEQYVWGMGEIMGTGPTNHNDVMTTVFRTYGYWKIKFSTKYAAQGFKVNATPGNQLYYGYGWETAHPNIKIGAEATRGNLVMYLSGGTNEIALTPYSSWTDGRTRSFEERWGDTRYPWCLSVTDLYGKNLTMTTAELETAGNHMVGLSANGSLKLAGTDYNWQWDDILKYYFHSINIRQAY